jgi:glycosyltransferase involved in cell wall biosynthesis
MEINRMNLDSKIRKNILIVTSFPFPHLGGVSSGLFNEAVYLANNNHRVSFMFTKSEVEIVDKLKHQNILLLPLDNVESHSIFRLFIHRLFRAFRFAVAIKNLNGLHQIGVIHAHDVFCAFASALAGQRKKTILHLHSIASMDKFVMGESFLNLSLGRKLIYMIDFIADSFLEILTYNFVSRIICVSEYEYNDSINKLIDKNKSSILRNGIDANVFKFNKTLRNDLRCKWNIDQNIIICMFLGRMVPKNGPSIICESIPIINQEFSKILFVFVGNGVEKDKIANYIKANKLLNVRLIEGMPSQEILPLADIFISHVSSEVEGHGQTILEAMASEIPTITGMDSIKEKIFSNGMELFLVEKDNPSDIANAIYVLCCDKKTRDNLSLAGRKKVENDFSLSKSMTSLEKVLLYFP